MPHQELDKNGRIRDVSDDAAFCRDLCKVSKDIKLPLNFDDFEAHMMDFVDAGLQQPVRHVHQGTRGTWCVKHYAGGKQRIFAYGGREDFMRMRIIADIVTTTMWRCRRGAKPGDKPTEEQLNFPPHLIENALAGDDNFAKAVSLFKDRLNMAIDTCKWVSYFARPEGSPELHGIKYRRTNTLTSEFYKFTVQWQEAVLEDSRERKDVIHQLGEMAKGLQDVVRGIDAGMTVLKEKLDMLIGQHGVQNQKLGTIWNEVLAL